MSAFIREMTKLETQLTKLEFKFRNPLDFQSINDANSVAQTEPLRQNIILHSQVSSEPPSPKNRYESELTDI